MAAERWGWVAAACVGGASASYYKEAVAEAAERWGWVAAACVGGASASYYKEAVAEAAERWWRRRSYGGGGGLELAAAALAGREAAAVAIVAAAVVLLAWLCFRLRRSTVVYLVDMVCYRPPHILRSPHSTFLEHSKLSGIFDDESLEFQRKILERSGLGQRTSFPLCFRHLPPKPSMEAAREEAEAVLCSCTAELLQKTNVSPKDIAVVVVNCSTFSPSPSLCSLIVNRFKLRCNVKTFNLAGMGCSASVVAIALARDALLAGGAAAYALVLSTENITRNWYWGKNRTMLVSNCLFRVGGAAILLSNRGGGSAAKYRLEHVVRTHTGGDDDVAYGAAYQQEDEEGNVGVFLSKELMRIAAAALAANARRLAPLVLPYSEQAKFVADYVRRSWAKSAEERRRRWVPDFRKAFDHFCIHSGGRAVLDAVEAGLGLGEAEMEAARMALHRFGNTSVSTTWYQMQYLESRGLVKKGDRIWQIAFGSGFKCNSAVWVALRSVHGGVHCRNAWSDCILDYPLPLN